MTSHGQCPRGGGLACECRSGGVCQFFVGWMTSRRQCPRRGGCLWMFFHSPPFRKSCIRACCGRDNYSPAEQTAKCTSAMGEWPLPNQLSMRMCGRDDPSPRKSALSLRLAARASIDRTDLTGSGNPPLVATKWRCRPPSGGGLRMLTVRNSSAISGGFRQLRKYDSDVIYRNLCVCDAARMNTGVNRQADRVARRQTNP